MINFKFQRFIGFVFRYGCWQIFWPDTLRDKFMKIWFRINRISKHIIFNANTIPNSWVERNLQRYIARRAISSKIHSSEFQFPSNNSRLTFIQRWRVYGMLGSITIDVHFIKMVLYNAVTWICIPQRWFKTIDCNKKQLRSYIDTKDAFRIV